MFGKYFVVFFIYCLVDIQGFVYSSDINGWLKLHRKAADWQDARVICHVEGAVLAADWNYKVRSAINKLQSSEGQSYSVLHVGAHVTLEANDDGKYVYIEGEPPLLDEPGVVRSDPCVGFLANGTLGEVDCGKKLPFACFTAAPACGQNNLGYTFFKKTKHCYKFHRGPQSWTDAYDICKQEGGYLAVINSYQEIVHLRQLNSQALKDTSTSIGHYYWTVSNAWWTVTGQTLAEVGFSYWRSNEPSSEDSPDTNYKFGFLDSQGLSISEVSNKGFSLICEKNTLQFNSCYGEFE